MGGQCFTWNVGGVRIDRDVPGEVGIRVATSGAARLANPFIWHWRDSSERDPRILRYSWSEFPPP